MKMIIRTETIAGINHNKLRYNSPDAQNITTQ
jgi:hypothetical protein